MDKFQTVLLVPTETVFANMRSSDDQRLPDIKGKIAMIGKMLVIRDTISLTVECSDHIDLSLYSDNNAKFEIHRIIEPEIASPDIDRRLNTLRLVYDCSNFNNRAHLFMNISSDKYNYVAKFNHPLIFRSGENYYIFVITSEGVHIKMITNGRNGVSYRRSEYFTDDDFMPFGASAKSARSA